MTDPAVTYQVEDSIATITINAADNRNALTEPVREGLRTAFSTFNADESARVAILTGAGDRCFCAGGDLKDLQSLQTVPRDYVPMPGRNMDVDKPWIAAVNGYAVGGGVLYTMLADMAIAADTAQFSMPEARISRGAPWSVPLLTQIPRKVWFEMAITGNMITAYRAQQIGLVNHVVPQAELTEAARALAEKIVRAAPLTVRATLKMIRSSTQMGESAAWDIADELFRQVYASEDGIEGPKAWLEKRDPVWTGH